MASATLRDVLAPVAVVIARQQDLPVDANGAAVVQGVADALASGATDIVKGDHLVVSGQKFVKADTAIFTKALLDQAMGSPTSGDAPLTAGAIAAPASVAPTAVTSAAIAAPAVAIAAAATTFPAVAIAAAATTFPAVAIAAAATTAAALPDGSSVVASDTVTNIAAPTAFVPTHTVDANTLAIGDVVEVYASGTQVAQNAADTLALELMFGANQVLITPALSCPAGDVWTIHGFIAIRTIGAGGTFVASGYSYLGTPSAVGGANDVASADFIGSTGIDTTGAITVSVRVTHGAASAGNQTRLDILSVRVVRPEAAASLVNELKTQFDVLQGEVAGEVQSLVNEIQTQYDVLRGEAAGEVQDLLNEIQTQYDVLRGEVAGEVETLVNETRTTVNAIRVDLETAAAPIRTTVDALVVEMAELRLDYTALLADYTTARTLLNEIKGLFGDNAEVTAAIRYYIEKVRGVALESYADAADKKIKVAIVNQSLVQY